MGEVSELWRIREQIAQKARETNYRTEGQENAETQDYGTGKAELFSTVWRVIW